ncbi:hypothetical protein [Pseudogracilibacillus auburnensis]|uniref:hypothetical protein n=1 Tax=Pseudogracilibacillus auburnensis TaxID=1494959 RepID=UPI001A95CDCD|nr:hypothetical protein [Pseudogracilibacillus auburnensis]MBO1003756.1 hypothetical protein [Pseudogracilibacillus auburnensis]
MLWEMNSQNEVNETIHLTWRTIDDEMKDEGEQFKFLLYANFRGIKEKLPPFKTANMLLEYCNSL